MSNLINRMKSDRNFALELQGKAEKLRQPGASKAEVEEVLGLMTESPEQLEKLTAALDTDAGVQASITITTLTTFTTFTAA